MKAAFAGAVIGVLAATAMELFALACGLPALHPFVITACFTTAFGAGFIVGTLVDASH